MTTKDKSPKSTQEGNLSSVEEVKSISVREDAVTAAATTKNKMPKDIIPTTIIDTSDDNDVRSAATFHGIWMDR